MDELLDLIPAKNLGPVLNSNSRPKLSTPARNFNYIVMQLLQYMQVLLGKGGESAIQYEVRLVLQPTMPITSDLFYANLPVNDCWML